MQSNMDDPAVTSAANTLRGWMVRRLAYGKAVTDEMMLARLAEIWPDASSAERDGVLGLVVQRKDA